MDPLLLILIVILLFGGFGGGYYAYGSSSGSSASSGCSSSMSACSESRCALTETYSPTAIDIEPATSPAIPAIKTVCFDAEAAATPIMRLAVDTIASSEPSTAARSHLERLLRCASRCRIGPRFTCEPRTLDQRNRAKQGKSNQTESSRSTLELRQSTSRRISLRLATSTSAR